MKYDAAVRAGQGQTQKCTGRHRHRPRRTSDFYLAWLLSVQAEEVGDEEAEPPVPPGLRTLSAPLHAVADVLEQGVEECDRRSYASSGRTARM